MNSKNVFGESSQLIYKQLKERNRIEYFKERENNLFFITKYQKYQVNEDSLRLLVLSTCYR